MPEEQTWTTEKSSNGSSVGNMAASTEPLHDAADSDRGPGELSRDQLCGLGSWRPACLQGMANHRMYVVAYVIIGVVQGMIMAYFGGVLTTLEKVFGIKSSDMGLVLAGNDISQILLGLVINHIGNRGSRPFWLSVGMLMTGASCFLYAATHLLWNSRDYDMGGFDDGHATSSSSSQFRADFCAPDRRQTTSSFEAAAQTSVTVANVHDAPSLLGSVSQADGAVLTLLFVGQLVSGIGSTAIFSLGFTYMDDSLKKKNTPMYTGLTSALRCLGPVLGFLLASFCLNLNVKPAEQSHYARNDKLFIGCWWLGFVLLGILQVAITFPMLLFPKTLPSEKLNAKELAPVEKSAWKDFRQSMVRMCRNPVVVSYMILVGPFIIGSIGFGIFMPKYLEAQFGQTPGNASQLSGVTGMAMLMVGTFIGGVIMWKYQPSTLYVTGFSCVLDVLHIVSTFFMMMLDCGKEEFAGVDLYNDRAPDITSDCSRSCFCGLEFNPVCVGTTNFLSPCLAGCTAVDTSNSRTFLNCMCAAPQGTRAVLDSINSLMMYNDSLREGSMSYELWSTGQMGYCPGGRSECTYLWPYLIIKGVSMLLGSTTRIGFILILVRSVEKRDKSLVLALLMVISSLTGFIPAPIVYGAAVDKACLLWNNKSDGQRGNCWVYDTQAFSYWIHGLRILCYVITTIMTFFICYYSRHVNLYDEDVDDSSPGTAVVLKDIKHPEVMQEIVITKEQLEKSKF